MNKRMMALLSAGLLTCGSTGHAAITGLSWGAAPGTPLDFSSAPTSSYSGDQGDLSEGASQLGAPATMAGVVTTDSAGDPDLMIHNSVNNDTGFAWQSYQVNVFFSAPFGLGSLFLNTPASWTMAPNPAREDVLVASGTYAGMYEWELDLTGPTPIPVGGILDFGYDMTFSGFTSFAFTQQLIPYASVSVPEPKTYGLVFGLALAGLAFGRQACGRMVRSIRFSDVQK